MDPAAHTTGSNSNAAPIRPRSRSPPVNLRVKPRGTVGEEIEAKEKADACTETQAEDRQSSDPVADGGEEDEDTLPLPS